MTAAPFYDDGRVTLWQGDAIECARQLADGSVACIVTSPPYFGLRDYGTGDEQIGAEPTLAEYIYRLVELFRELRRVLADDGTLWLNLGDSYANPGHYKGNAGSVGSIGKPRVADTEGGKAYEKMTPDAFAEAGLKNKDLIGVPWRVALALQADGWYLRSEIIWAKPNPMPESVTDRPTKSHEHVFLLSKSERYYYNAAAIAEPLAPASVARMSQNLEQQAGRARANGGTKHNGPIKAAGDLDSGMRNARDVWTIGTTSFKGAHFAVFPEELPRRCIRAGARPGGKRCDCDEPIGTPTGTDYDEGPDPLIYGRAGMLAPHNPTSGRRIITRAQQRADAEQLRQVERPADVTLDAWEHYLRTDRSGARALPPELRDQLIEAGQLSADPARPCDHPVEPAGVVLDPFSGSGTTGQVALLEGHPYVGFDLNPEYLALSLRERFAASPLDLAGLA